MKKNVGGMDRLMRFIVGASFTLWGILGGPWWTWIGVVILLTSITQKCFIYSLIGFTTHFHKRDFF
ncbi:MAG: DUF2892 domain-containing protein [bacterium]|nr:DUF2892 domain-containing protein [bacterium]